MITTKYSILQLRLLYVLHKRIPYPRKRGSPTRLLIVLGSGGHTAEMISLLENLDTRSYTHRSYVVGEGDDFSTDKAVEFEHGLARKATQQDIDRNPRAGSKNTYGSYDIAYVPRARKIHQSLLTTHYSSLRCLFACFTVLRRPAQFLGASRSLHRTYGYPDLVLTNGPATSVILILASLLLRFVGLPGTRDKMRTIYVESWARVRKLSLSGRLVAGVVDRFLVQWEALRGKGEFRGMLVQ